MTFADQRVLRGEPADRRKHAQERAPRQGQTLFIKTITYTTRRAILASDSPLSQ